MNDTLISSTVYQFDIYIYQTGTTPLYLNNYQLSFQVSNTTGILNGGVLTGAYIAGSTQLPAALTPGGVNLFNVGGNYEYRVNGVSPNSNGSLIPTTGLRIGTFQIINSVAFAQATGNIIWWNAIPAATYVYAIEPPGITGTSTLITDMSSHTTNLTNPLLNTPVFAFNMTGATTYCTGSPGVVLGLDGSQIGVIYRLFQNSSHIGTDISGTGAAISFGTYPAGTYTSTAYRKATYLTGNMNGSLVVTALANNPVSVAIAASSNPVCSGTSVTFTANPTNGGTTPTYQWKVNGISQGPNSSTFTYTPVNTDAISCVLTSNAGCATGNPATSNTVTMAVNAVLPVSVSIVPSSNPICSGTSVTFTATPTNEGTTPTYQWKVNGISQGTNNATYTYTPLNNDAITCVLTSNASCPSGNPATSNTVTMSVNPVLPVSVAIAASSNP
jgi:predicted secreted protein